MSRSVSAPSSVTKTSPCWNGLIVPGSTLRYGSNFWSWTRSPRAFSRRPSEAATIPFPRAETTPPVTKTYFGARALTGFQGSSGNGRSLGRGRPNESGEICEHLRREGATDAAEPLRLDDERRRRLIVLVRLELQLDPHALGDQLEDDLRPRHDLDQEQLPSCLGPPPEAHRRPSSVDLPQAAGDEAAASGVDRLDSGPPLREPLGIGEHRPHVVDGRRQDPPSRVPRQGTPVRRACARAPPSAPPRRAARSGCASDRPASSPPGSADRRARRSAAGA